MSPGQSAQGEEGVDPDLVSAAESLGVREGEPSHQAACGLPQRVATHNITPLCHRFVTSTKRKIHKIHKKKSQKCQTQNGKGEYCLTYRVLSASSSSFIVLLHILTFAIEPMKGFSS